MWASLSAKKKKKKKPSELCQEIYVFILKGQVSVQKAKVALKRCKEEDREGEMAVLMLCIMESLLPAGFQIAAELFEP